MATIKVRVKLPFGLSGSNIEANTYMIYNTAKGKAYITVPKTITTSIFGFISN